MKIDEKYLETIINEYEESKKITAKNWWHETLSTNNQKELLTKYDEYFDKMESHKLGSIYNKKTYPSIDLIVKMWEEEGSTTFSEFTEKMYGYGDLTDKDFKTKIHKQKHIK